MVNYPTKYTCNVCSGKVTVKKGPLSWDLALFCGKCKAFRKWREIDFGEGVR
jgi:hypothetical protein